jgi:hypothetical protein
MVTHTWAEHPLASVTVTQVFPAQRLFTVAVVAPLLHKKVYGAIPPATVTVALPLQIPAPVALLLTVAVGTGPARFATVAVPVAEHPLASVAVTLYVPAAIFVAVAVVCTGVVFQL